MNIAEYLQNPLGKGSSVLMLTSIRKNLDEEYHQIVSRMSCTWYSFQDQYYVAHIKVPSRSVERLYYDVLLEIDVQSIPKSSSVINGGNVRVFSNCPSFAFTYAYAFNEKGDLIPWTRSKYGKKILSEEPKKRNPMKIESYEKSLYFAMKFITSNGRNYKNRINFHIAKVNTHLQILSPVQSLDEVLYNYRNKKEKEIPNKKETKNSERSKTPIKRDNYQKGKSGTTKTVKTVGRVGKISKTKKSKKSSRI